MNGDGFTQQIETASRRAQELSQRVDESLPWEAELLATSQAELSTALEELRVVDEELGQQNQELIATRQAAEAERQRYQDLFEFAPDGYLVTDMNGIIQEANRAAAGLLNIRQQSLIGKPLATFVIQEARRALRSELIRLQQVDRVEWETRLQPRNSQGEPAPSFDADLTTVTVRDPEGKPVALRWLLRNVTVARRLAEEHQQVEAALALAESEARFRSLIQHSSDVIVILEPSGMIRYTSPSIERVLGYAPEELVGKNAFDLTHPAEVPAILAHFDKLVQYLGTTQSVEFRFRRKDSSWCYLEATGSNLLAEPSVAGIVVNSRDVTERKQVAERLQQLNADLDRQVQERTAQLQQALDFEATLKRITDKVRDSLDESQILQTAVQELALVLGVICCDTALYNLDQRTSTIRYEYTIPNFSTPSSQGYTVQMADFPEGYAQLLQGQYFQFCEADPTSSRYQLTILACPILFDDREVLGDLWLFHQQDRTFDEFQIQLVQQVANQCVIAIRQAQLYQVAQAQVEELAKLNQLKDDFLSTVSHEIRTPLSNMKMAIHMLKVAPDLKRREHYLEILQAECAKEVELVNDLLDLQQLEADSYSIASLAALNLQVWLPQIIQPFQSRSRDRQQTLQVNLSADLPPLISDRTSLERILTELLNNACKYTSSGGHIDFSIHYAPSCIPSDSTRIFTFIISNEADIPAAELPHLFEKFYRPPRANPWNQRGTGLGLALVQKLVEQLQGSIQVKSDAGWTTFSVQLPAQTHL